MAQVCIYVYIQMYMCKCIYTYACMNVYRDICIILRGRYVRRLGGSGLHICMHTEIDVYMYVYTFVVYRDSCGYVCRHICMYTEIYV